MKCCNTREAQRRAENRRRFFADRVAAGWRQCRNAMLAGHEDWGWCGVAMMAHHRSMRDQGRRP